jgi:site-specific recombinase XerD
MRGIYERVKGSGNWYIRYANERGKIIHVRSGSKSVADKLLAKRKTEVLQRKHLPETIKRRDVLFSELMNDAMEAGESNGASAQRNLSGIVKALTPTFGKRIASAITTEELTEWLRTRKRQHCWANGTYNGYITQLRLIFRFGVKMKKVHDNPALCVEKLTLGFGKPRYLTVQEEEALDRTVLEQFPKHWDAYQFAKNTGLRASAQLGLTWAMVSFERQEITLPAKRNSKYKQAWPLPMNTTAWEIIERRKARADESFYVFAEYHTEQSWRGVPAHWFPAIVKAAGISDFTWHSLRHNFASQLVMRHADLSSVSRLMAHTNLKQTDLYAKLSTDHLRAAASLMDAHADPPRPSPSQISRRLKLVPK